MTDKLLKNILEELIRVMDIKADVIESKELGLKRYNIVCDEAGYLIGQAGTNLGALEYLFKAIAYKTTGQQLHFFLDINDYRQARIDFLKKIALEASQEVLGTNRPYRFQPLSAFERRIIHAIIAENYSNLSTQSDGEGCSRRVMLLPKE